MAAAIPIVSIAATGFQVYNQYQQGVAAASAAAANSRRIIETAEFNAGMLTRQGEVASAMVKISGEYGAAVARNNAVIFENAAIVSMQDAQRSRQQGQYEADRTRDRNKRLKGAQIAAVGRSGILLEGSPSDVIFDSAIQGELDALAAEYIGKIGERQHLVEAVNRKYSARLARHRGSVILTEAANNSNIALWESDVKSKLLLTEAYLQSSGLLREGRSALRQSYWNMGSTLLTNMAFIGSTNPGFLSGNIGRTSNVRLTTNVGSRVRDVRGVTPVQLNF